MCAYSHSELLWFGKYPTYWYLGEYPLATLVVDKDLCLADNLKKMVIYNVNGSKWKYANSLLAQSYIYEDSFSDAIISSWVIFGSELTTAPLSDNHTLPIQ